MIGEGRKKRGKTRAREERRREEKEGQNVNID